MNMQDLVTWIGAASGTASLITLVYLSIQVRQNNLLMRAGARQAQVETDQDHIRQFIEYPDIAASFASAGPITEEARIRLNFWIVASLRAREYEWLPPRAAEQQQPVGCEQQQHQRDEGFTQGARPSS